MTHFENMTTNVWNEICFDFAGDGPDFCQKKFDQKMQELIEEYVNDLWLRHNVLTGAYETNVRLRDLDLKEIKELKRQYDICASELTALRQQMRFIK